MSIVPSSSPLGSVVTKQQLDVLQSVSLEDLFSELTRRLTGLEKLGLLSEIGKSLKLFVPVTDTPSTAGPVGNVVLPKESQASSTTSTSLRLSEAMESLPDWRSLPQRQLTLSPNRGQLFREGTTSGGTLGCTGPYLACRTNE